MKNYYRVMLGRKSVYAKVCFDGGFTGTHFGIQEDLTGKLPETWRPFNAAYVPKYLAIHPDKSKVAAGLACGAIWTVSKMLRPGDVILSPDGTGRYRVGEIEGEYWYAEGDVLPHRRTVRWHDVYIDRAAMSEVSRIMARVIGVREAKSASQAIYDPTCGSGSLLLRAHHEAPVDLTIYGQEKDVATRGLAVMNMFLHNVPTADIRAGNTLNFCLGPGRWREGAQSCAKDWASDIHL